MKAHWLLALLLGGSVATACGTDVTPTEQRATNSEDTGRFEIVRERTNAEGGLEIRVRAERIDAADRIAQKLAALKKSSGRSIAKVEVIGMKDPADGPTRRMIDHP